MTETDGTAGTVVFDGDCGFCTRCVAFLARIDSGHRVRRLPAQDPSATAVAGADPDALNRTVYWVGADDVVRTGAAAVNAALSAALGLALPLRVYRWPGMATVQEWVYRWVAEHRGRFPGVTPWCRTHPAQCGRDGPAER